MNIFESFVRTSCETFALSKGDFDNVTPNMISPFVLELPRSILEQAQNIVSDLYSLYNNKLYQNKVAQNLHSKSVSTTSLAPLLCSLDVHVTPENTLKIIEINTNASAYLITVMNYKARNIETFPKALEDLASSFKATIALNSPPDQILAIMDEDPKTQKQYIEFLMYKEFFNQSLGIEAQIVDPKQFTLSSDGSLSLDGKTVFGIYNRHTDFFLESLPQVLQAHNSQKVNLSPHPWGYALLADKQRMLDVQTPDWCNGLSLDAFPHLQKALLETISFSHFASADELWQQRHKYFFKPSDSYGSKSVYNGKSISRKKFDEIFSPKMLAQETAPAPEATFNHNGTPETFKYDLRFFFFENKVQLAFARTYRGQLTNLQTPLGGHAPLVFG